MVGWQSDRQIVAQQVWVLIHAHDGKSSTFFMSITKKTGDNEIAKDDIQKVQKP